MNKDRQQEERRERAATRLGEGQELGSSMAALIVTENGSRGKNDTPRTVSRGVKNQLAHLGIDSLYLVIEYPYVDVFERWRAGVMDLDEPRLHEGVPYEGYVLKRGGLGYKLSVWDGDARLYLTDRVTEKLPDGVRGMGAMLQLGPKWLAQFGAAHDPDALRGNVVGQLQLFGMEDAARYPMRINRLDVALDVQGLDVRTFSIDEWSTNWGGYAKLRKSFFGPRTGALTGFRVGTAQGNVSLRVYDKALESLQRGTSGFWRSVWGIPEEAELPPVTRFEWSVRCYKANMPGLRYLSEYTFEGFLGLLNYVVQRWGSLYVPEADAQHKSRGPLHPLWAELQGYVAHYSNHYQDMVRPQYHLNPDIKPEYLQSMAGWLAGLQARLGVEWGLDGPASLAQVLGYLHEQGHSIEEIARKAGVKWEVLAALAGDA